MVQTEVIPDEYRGLSAEETTKRLAPVRTPSLQFGTRMGLVLRCIRRIMNGLSWFACLGCRSLAMRGIARRRIALENLDMD